MADDADIPVPPIAAWVSTDPDLPAQYRAMGMVVLSGRPLTVFTFGATVEEVREKTRAWWIGEKRRELERKRIADRSKSPRRDSTEGEITNV